MRCIEIYISFLFSFLIIMHRHKQSLFAPQEEQEDNYWYKSKYSSWYRPQQYQPTIYWGWDKYTWQYQQYWYWTLYWYDRDDWFSRPSTYQYQKVDYSSKYSFASNFEYVRPDHKKIREKLKQKQLQLNKQWYSIKIEYWSHVDFSRTQYWFAKVYCPSLSVFDQIRKFLDKNTKIWIIKLTSKDVNIYNSITTGNSISVDENIIPSKRNVHWFTWFDFDRHDYNLYRYSVIDIEWDKESKSKDFHYWWTSSYLKKITINKNEIQKMSEIIKNKLRIKSDIKIKNVSLSKWKRINRNFILNYSYKPLEYISTFLRKKKKVLMVIDWSWSMNGWASDWYFHKAALSSFALRDTWLFEASVFFTTEDTLSYANGYDAYYISQWEWFEYLKSRLSKASIDYSMFDYIFIFTDLNVSSSSQEEIAAICWSKKHIVFSFDEKHMEKYQNMYSSMKIKYVKSVQNIIDSVINFV